MKRIHLTFLTLALGLLAPIYAHAQVPDPSQSLHEAQPVPPPTQEYTPNPWPKQSFFGVNLSASAGGVAEAFSDAPELNWAGAEWSAAFRLEASRWSGKACFPFCGPLWTDDLGARLDLRARGLVTESPTESGARLDLHMEESSEFALWVFSIGQTFSFQRDAAFWLNFWRPHSQTMSAGVKGGFSMLSAAEQDGGVEVVAVNFDWRRLMNEGESGWTGFANEVRADVALVTASAEPGYVWYEHLGIGVLAIEAYDIPLLSEGQTAVNQEALSFSFDFAVLEGFRGLDDWKLDTTLGLSMLSPFAEVRRTPITNSDGSADVDYAGGPSVIAPHIWLAAHHVSGKAHGEGRSLVFEAIPLDADFGVGMGSFQRIDPSGMAADVGAQLAGYARVPLSSNITLGGEAIVIGARRSMVSALSPELPLQPGDMFAMGRLELKMDWAISDHWTVFTNAWGERSDRESSANANNSVLGPTNRLGVRTGLYLSY